MTVQSFCGRFPIVLAACLLAGCGALTTTETSRALRDYVEAGEQAFRQGRHEEALESWQSGLSAAREAGADVHAATFLTNIGVSSVATGDYQQALESHAQALSIRRKLGDRRGEAAALTNLGDAYFSLALYDEAQSAFAEALTIEKRDGNARGEAANLSNLGVVHARLGDDDTARRYAAQALRINRALGDERQTRIGLNNLGVYEKNLGNLAAAADAFAEAMRFAQAASDEHALAIALGNAGLLRQQQGQPRARDLLERSRAILTRLGDRESAWRVSLGLARVEVESGNYDGAVAHYRDAIDAIESLRASLSGSRYQATYLENRLVAYDELIAAYRALAAASPAGGYDEAAFSVFERRQGRAFLRQVAESGARRFSGVPEAIVAREREIALRTSAIRSRLIEGSVGADESARLARELETLSSEAQKIARTLAREHPRYFEMKYGAGAAPGRVRRALGPDEVIVAYHVTESEGTAWLIDDDGLSMHRLDGGEAAIRVLAARLGDNVQELVSAIQRGEPVYRLRRLAARLTEPWHAASFELYSLLFPPSLRSALAPGERLYIVPSGAVYDVPFAALATGDTGADPGYLVEDHAIAYLASASLLALLREPAGRVDDERYPLLAFADPAYEDGLDAPGASWPASRERAFENYVNGRFANIPDGAAAARELREILHAPPGSEPLLLGDQVTRERILNLNENGRLDDYRFVFFSVHGVLPGEVKRVVQPALVLSNPGMDGFLTMADVLGLKLDADVVTLSACNTARGDKVRGEGVMGMTRAFMYAGADTVGATLWSVESRSVQRLATRMHAGIATGEPRAEALRAAGIDMLSGSGGMLDELYSHPYFWAPLVLYGDGA